MRTHQDQSLEFRTKQVRYLSWTGMDTPQPTFDPRFCRMLKYSSCLGSRGRLAQG